MFGIKPIHCFFAVIAQLFSVICYREILVELEKNYNVKLKYFIKYTRLQYLHIQLCKTICIS